MKLLNGFNAMKKLLLAVLLTTLFTASAHAGFDEGMAAYQKNNFSLALKEFTPLAEQGLAEAQFSLGVMYREGQGVPQNNAQAVGWYQKAAERGYAKAQISLALMYSRGQGVPKDESIAADWLRKAAEQGDATAQFLLGIKYTTGNGVMRDAAQGAKWYLKAAEQGVVNAQLQLANFYFDLDTLQDDIQAAKWFHKAAENNNPMAQAMLAGIYMQGRGVTQNVVIVYALLNINSAYVDSSNTSLRDTIEKIMTTKQIQAAKLLMTEMAKPNNLNKAIEAFLKNPT
jgi:uncharacterized protein